MRKQLLLPSARLIPTELQTEFGPITSAMVPIGARPALRYIAEPYVADGFEVVVAVDEGASQVEEYIALNPDLRARAVRVGPTKTIAETVSNVVALEDPLPDFLVINFADTFVGTVLDSGNVVCYQPQTELFRWTTFEIDDDGRMSNVQEKNLNKSLEHQLPVFVGVFCFDDVDRFVETLRAVMAEPSKEPIDDFYVAVRICFNTLPSNRRALMNVADWRDFGHLDTYYATKRAHFVNARNFNHVAIDARRGIVRKSSHDVDKLRNEAQWYQNLPPHLAYVAPRLFGHDLKLKTPYLDLEFYGYPALNDVYLFGKLDIGVWCKIFDAIQHVLEAFRECRRADDGISTPDQAMRHMYERKTLNRLRPILNDPRFEMFHRPRITINGRECLGLPAVRDLLPRALEALGICDQTEICVIHGDFCFSNILYDRRNGFIRLIDPRGEFGPYDVHGDPRYDLAKLCHSVEGDYDFFANDLFDLSWDGPALSFRPHVDSRHEEIKDLFAQWLKVRWGADYDQVRLIQGLLFLSMIPLHGDRFLSQQAFLGRGLEIFTDVVTRAGLTQKVVEFV